MQPVVIKTWTECGTATTTHHGRPCFPPNMTDWAVGALITEEAKKIIVTLHDLQRTANYVIWRGYKN